MAFDTLYLSSAGGQSKRGKAPQQFTYKTADTMATVLASGYIGATYARLFSVGDKIDIVIVDDIATPTQVIQTGTIMIGGITSAGVVTTVDLSNAAFNGVNTIRMPFFFDETDLLAGTTQQTIAPVAGTVKRIVTCVKKQVTTGGAIGLTVAGSAVTGLSVTIGDAATVGTVQSDTPTSVTRVAAYDALGVTAAAAFATAGEVFGFVEIIPDVYTGHIYVPYFFNQTDLLAGTSQWWAAPEAGTITELASTIQLAVTTGGVIAVELATVAVTGLELTIADAAVAGTVQHDAPTSGGTVTKEQVIEVTATAAFATAGRVNGYVAILPTLPTRKAYVFFRTNETDTLAGTSHFVASPIAGNVTRAVTATNIAVGTGGTLTFELGGTAVLGLAVVVANSAAAGDIDRDNSTSPTDITTEIAELGAIEVVGDANFATTGSLTGFVEVTPRAA
jgi:hypothetical protein